MFTIMMFKLLRLKSRVVLRIQQSFI